MFFDIFLLFSVLCFTKASVLEILPKKGYAVLLKKSQFNISCISHDHNISPQDLQWTDNFGKIVIYNHIANLSTVYYTVTPHANVLNFNRTLAEDNGTYICTHKHHVAKFNIFVYEEIELKSAKEQFLRRGASDAVLECKSKAYPHPSIRQWLFNGQPIKNGVKYLLTRDKRLYLRMVRMEDAGKYQCLVSLPTIYNHSRSFDISVVVQDSMSIIGFKDSLDILEGTDLNFSCQIYGTCPCTYSFTHEGTKLAGSERIIINTGQVSISPVSRRDAGVYKCMVNNQVSKDSATVTVNVIIQPRVLSFKSVDCEEGSECVLECKVEAAQGSVSHITRQSQYLPMEHEKGTSTYRVVYKKVELKHAGEYLCSTISQYGKNSSQAHLHVLFKPRAVEGQMALMYTWKNQVRNITCEVKAHPAPSFHWIARKKDVAMDTENHDVTLIQPTIKTGPTTYLSVLRLTMNDRKYHRYFNPLTCNVNNSMGNTSIVIEIQRAMTPNVPTLKDHKLYPEEVWLFLEPAEFTGFLPLLGHFLQVKQNSKLLAEHSFSLAETVRVRNLEPDTEYKIIYSSFNQVGKGVTGRLVFTTTSPRKPYEVHLVAENTSVRLSPYTLHWLHPIGVGAPIKKFVVSYRMVENSSELTVPVEDWVRQEEAGTALSSKLIFYRYNSTYQVSVRAYNTFGYSEPHAPFYVHTFTVSDTGEEKEVEIKGAASEFLFSSTQGNQASRTKKGSVGGSRAWVFLLVFLVLVAFLLLVDGSCYYLKGTSITASLCMHLRGDRKKLFRKEVSDARSPLHSNSKHVLQPEEDVAKQNNPLIPNKSHQQPPVAVSEATNHFSTSITSNSTSKSENLLSSLRDDLYIASEDMGTFDEEEDEEDGGRRSYIT